MLLGQPWKENVYTGPQGSLILFVFLDEETIWCTGSKCWSQMFCTQDADSDRSTDGATGAYSSPLL